MSTTPARKLSLARAATTVAKKMEHIETWLESIGLPQYRSLFKEHQVDFDVLHDITNEDLKELGIPLGDRKRFLRAIPLLRVDTGSVAQNDAGERVTREEESSAERRQVTILFCDVVGSTELASRLDPEELAAVMAVYQDRCKHVVDRWDGHLAEFLGDGAVIYFGWPKAHEDDAERAVYAALDLVEDLPAGDGVLLSARAGIATGLVLVGEIRSAGLTQRDGVVGKTPNLAARVQALTLPGTVAITSHTRRLVGHRFDLEHRGAHVMKGLTKPADVWIVRSVLANKSRFEARAGSRVVPLVGRRQELTRLVSMWAECTTGAGATVLVSGEAGIGKSRLLQALAEETESISHYHLTLQCSPHHANTPLRPFIEWLNESAGITSDLDPEMRLDKINAYVQRVGCDPKETVPLVAALLSVPLGTRFAPLNVSPQLQRDRTIQFLIDLVHQLADVRPTLVVVEDLHWADPTTLELLTRLIDHMKSLSGLLVLTSRPEFESPFDHGTVQSIDLGRLESSSTIEMVEHLTGQKVIRSSIRDSILSFADGIPLFVEELTRALRVSGSFRSVGSGSYPAETSDSDLAIPGTLHELLLSQLDSIPAGKLVAQVAATVGRSFSLSLLRDILPSHPQLTQNLHQLCEAGILEPERENNEDTVYGFRHALLRETAYQSQLKTRRREVHVRVADALERNYPNLKESEPEVLAHHNAEGGRAHPAAEYLLSAGRKAIQACATQEAVTHLSRGLHLIKDLPGSGERDRTELRLQAVLGTSYMQAKGWAASEVEVAYGAAGDLSHAAETTAEEIWILWGIWVYHQVRGRIDDAIHAGQRIRVLADREQDEGLGLVADMVSLQMFLYAGRFPESYKHCESFTRRYDAERDRPLTDQYSTDLQLVCYVHQAITLWVLGDVRRARDLAQRTGQLVSSLEHPYSVAWGNIWGSVVDLLVGDADRAVAKIEAGVRAAEENNFSYVTALGKMMTGWMEGLRGHPQQGAENIAVGLAEFSSTGAEIVVPFFETLRAELMVATGRFDDALEALVNTEDQIDRWGERWQEAEVHRVRGNALAGLGPDAAAKAEESYRNAIDIAVRQGAKGWQLRACTDYARFLDDQLRSAAGKKVLEPMLEAYANTPPTKDGMKATAVMETIKARLLAGKDEPR